MSARQPMNPAADEQLAPEVRRIIAYVTRYDHVPVLLENVHQLANVIRRLGHDIPPVARFNWGGRPWEHAILDRTLPPLVRDVVIELVAAYARRTPAWARLPRTQAERRQRAAALRETAADVHRLQRVWTPQTHTYWIGVPRDMRWAERVAWFWRQVRRPRRGRPGVDEIAPMPAPAPAADEARRRIRVQRRPGVTPRPRRRLRAH